VCVFKVLDAVSRDAPAAQVEKRPAAGDHRGHPAHRAPAPRSRRVRRRHPPDPIIPTGKRKGRSPSLASLYRALAEHDKHQRYPEAVAQSRADFTTFQPDTQ